MALNKAQTQWVMGGIIIGVLGTLGVQYAMSSYEASQFSSVIAGFEAATDKSAYLDNYLTAKAAKVSVELSFADASESCKELWSRETTLNIYKEAMDNARNSGDISEETYNNMYYYWVRDFYDVADDLQANNCYGGDEDLYLEE